MAKRNRGFSDQHLEFGLTCPIHMAGTSGGMPTTSGETRIHYPLGHWNRMRGLLFSTWKSVVLWLVNSCHVPPSAGHCSELGAALLMDRAGSECHMSGPCCSLAASSPAKPQDGRKQLPKNNPWELGEVGFYWVKALGQPLVESVAKRPIFSATASSTWVRSVTATSIPW